MRDTGRRPQPNDSARMMSHRVDLADDVDAAYLDGYRTAVADVARDSLFGDAIHVAPDIRVQLGLLRGLLRRGDVQAIASVLSAIDALTADPTFAKLTRRELRLFCGDRGGVVSCRPPAAMRRLRATFSRAPCVLLIESLLRRCEL